MSVPEDGGTGRGPQAGAAGAVGGGPLDGLPDLPDMGAYVVDERGRIAQVSRRAEELLGRPAAELLGRDAHDLLHRDGQGRALPRARCPMLQAFLGGRTERGDLEWFERGDGSPLASAWLVTPCVLDGGRTGSLVLLHRSPSLRADGWEAPGTTAPLSELDRLALLAETTTRLTSTLDSEEALRRLVRLLVPRLADWAVVDLFTEEDEVWRTAVVGHEDGLLVNREDLEGPLPPVAPDSPMPLSRALRGAASTLTGPGAYEGAPDSGVMVVQRELFRETGIHSAVISPIRGLRDVLGALTLGRSGRSGAFGGTELSLLDDIARRAGLALDNARLYQRQRRVAETMQRHLLPQLPAVPGLEMKARYVPAPQASQVGGDWYDAFVLPDGATALAIGDVVGHDLDAAAGMAQIRNMLRAYAWSERAQPPGAVVARLDQAVQHIAEASMATLVFGRAERLNGGRWQLRWVNAGHPPPLLVTHDGQTRFLDDGHSLLLGTGMAPERSDAVVALPPLSTLVLYTDGLVESPGRSIDEGLLRMRQHAAALTHRPLGQFCDLLLSRVRPAGNDDDVAVLALRIPAGS